MLHQYPGGIGEESSKLLASFDISIQAVADGCHQGRREFAKLLVQEGDAVAGEKRVDAKSLSPGSRCREGSLCHDRETVRSDPDVVWGCCESRMSSPVMKVIAPKPAVACVGNEQTERVIRRIIFEEAMQR